MKKVLIIIVLMSLPLLSIGQAPVSTEGNSTIETTIEKESATEVQEKTVLKSETKAQVLDLNYKKSIDIISIKAYRQSLQIKVKTIKMC